MATKTVTKGGFLRVRSERCAYGYTPSLFIPPPTPVDFLSEVTYGPNVPDWKFRIANGLQAGTALYGIDRSPGTLSGNVSWRWTVRTPHVHGLGDPWYGVETASQPWMPISTNFTLNATDAYDACVIGFLEKVGNVSQKFSSGTFAGEIRQTLGMLRSPFRSLTRHLGSYLTRVDKRAFKNIRIPGSPSQVRRRRIEYRNRVVSETWLELQFGLKPLIHDIDDAMSALVSLSEVKPTWERISHTVVRETDREEYIVSPPFYSNVFGTTFKVKEVEKIIVKLIGAVSTDKTSKAKFDALGLNIRDFAPTVYELIPYSFLVDYFVNFGGLINALCVRQTGVRWKMKTTIAEISAKAGGRNNSSPLSYSGFPYSMHASDRSSCTEAKLRSVERSPWDILLAPQLVFRIPTADSAKWFNMAALTRQSRGLESRLRR